eukprot:6210148-Pleurochrysis_carterae.AAC.1
MPRMLSAVPPSGFRFSMDCGRHSEQILVKLGSLHIANCKQYLRTLIFALKTIFKDIDICTEDNFDFLITNLNEDRYQK